MKTPIYFKQENKYTCSLAVLRMVLATYGKKVSEKELVDKVEKDYGKNFQNIWNPTIAKLSCQYGVETSMYALWSIFKKDVYKKALADFKENPISMDFSKYEKSTTKEKFSNKLSLAYKEMFEAISLGCKCIYGKITKRRIKNFLAKGFLIQTSVKLNLLYPNKPKVFHSILIYHLKNNSVYYHDPFHGANLSCSTTTLTKAINNTGVALIYK